MLRSLVAGILIITLTSCTAWTTVPVSPMNYIRSHDPGSIRVTLQDGSVLVVGRPRVFGDTLRGITGGTYRNIPLDQIGRFEAQEPSKSKTAMLIAVGVVFAVGIGYVATSSDRVSQ